MANTEFIAVRGDITKDHGVPSISTGIYSFPLDQASVIAVRTAKEFVDEHPDALDVIKWVLFDDVTFGAYESQIRGL